MFTWTARYYLIFLKINKSQRKWVEHFKISLFIKVENPQCLLCEVMLNILVRTSSANLQRNYRVWSNFKCQEGEVHNWIRHPGKNNKKMRGIQIFGKYISHLMKKKILIDDLDKVNYYISTSVRAFPCKTHENGYYCPNKFLNIRYCFPGWRLGWANFLIRWGDLRYYDLFAANTSLSRKLLGTHSIKRVFGSLYFILYSSLLATFMAYLFRLFYYINNRNDPYFIVIIYSR